MAPPKTVTHNFNEARHLHYGAKFVQDRNLVDAQADGQIVSWNMAQTAAMGFGRYYQGNVRW